MIKRLQKKIAILFTLLLSILWCGLLCLFVYSTFRVNLMELRSDTRETIKETGWNNFFKNEGGNIDLSDLQYCVYSFDDAKTPYIEFHTFSKEDESTLKEVGVCLAGNWRKNKQTLQYTCIYKHFHKKQHYIILISSSPAWIQTLPTILISIVSLILGIMLFVLCGRLVSRMMTQPIDKTLQSEKEFIANASHELKSPLTVIRANTQMLQKEVSPDNHHLEYIHQETEHMIVLVNKLLTLARLDLEQNRLLPERFSVNESLCRIIYPMQSVAYEKGILITTDLQEGMYMVGMKDQIEELTSILLDNAISYTSKCGEITIRAYIQMKKIHLIVANTGDAIPKEIKDRLFERFFRADKAHASDTHYGLGLSIASSIVSKHGGAIHVDYVNDKNVFSVTLDVHPTSKY